MMDAALARERLAALRARRLAEDERLVCWERALILQDAGKRHTALGHTPRQAAVLRDLCAQITPVIEPEDVLLGSMPQVVPEEAQERFIAAHPEFFIEPGVPGVLDSLSIYLPDWDWLVERGLGGLLEEIRSELAAVSADAPAAEAQIEFLQAASEAVAALAGLFRRYADAARGEAALAACPARQAELRAAAARCDRLAESAPATFIEALQLLQITHLTLSCLVGGRDVTPGRLDQYLYPLYQQDVAKGRMQREEAVVLSAVFLLRLSQMAGNGTDFDDNLRRTPCRYSHLYVTVGGLDAEGRPAANELTGVLLDAVDLLDYKEPTLLVRWRADLDEGLRQRIAELVSRQRPVTIYNDEVVVAALTRQGVPLNWARGFAHSACHNVLVPGHEAGSGPAGFYNLPRLLLETMQETGLTSYEALWKALRQRVRAMLVQARAAAEARWETQLASACPLLQSALMRESVAAHRPCWQAASVSHFNYYLMGLATTVDSLLALRHVVYQEQRLSLGQFTAILAADWAGHDALRREIIHRLPRYGQDTPETRELAAAVGEMWVEEVEAVSAGMDRVAMWPGFYSHMVHVHEGLKTGATPDGRREGDPLSESLSPSFGTPPCAPTAVLNTMAALPFTHTPSGAASLALPVSGAGMAAQVQQLLEGYFAAGGLHLHLNVLGVEALRAALQAPDQHADLMVRVAGFSALFVRLSPEVQQDVVRRLASAPTRP